MERYHIFKLGLAVLFYAAYCARPMVHGLETEAEDVPTTTQKVSTPDDYYVYYQGVEGRPGIDFPVFSYIPRTGFSCRGMESGYYADLETDCQVFHICEEGKKISFLCPNGTIFQQSDLICEWWFKVNCTNSPNLYENSAEQVREEIIRRKASRRVYLNGTDKNHGAVLRTEENSSVSAKMNGKEVQINIERHEPPQDQSRKRVNLNQNNNRENIGRFSQNFNEGFEEQKHINPQKKENKPRKQFISQQEPEVVTTGSKDNTDQYVRISVSNTNKPVQFSIKNSDSRNRLESDRKNNQNDEYVRFSTNLNVAQRGSRKFVPSSPKNENNNRVNSSNKQTVPNQKNNNIKIKLSANLFNNNKQAGKATPVEEKQISTVPLTKNDIYSKKVEDDSDESQVVQETASFVKNSYNSIQNGFNFKGTSPNPYPNHRTTYSDLRKPERISTKNISPISSVTPQYITTQPINNGKPFLGSRVGTTFQPVPSTTINSLESFERDHPASPGFVPQSEPSVQSVSNFTSTNIENQYKPQSFNLGEVDKTLPPRTDPPKTTISSEGRDVFNVGKTDITIQPIAILTKKPSLHLEVPIPDSGSLNLGLNKVQVSAITTQSTTTSTIRPEEDFQSFNPNQGRTSVTPKPPRKLDHATVYGSFSGFVGSTTPIPRQNIDEVQIKFNNTKSAVEVSRVPLLAAVHKSRTNFKSNNPSSRTSKSYFVTSKTTQQSPTRRSSTTTTPSSKITDDGFTLGTSSSNYFNPNAIQRPRPFQKIQNIRTTENYPDFPTYQISSASPFAFNNEAKVKTALPTVPTPFTASPGLNSVYENVDNMINVLMEIANKDSGDHSAETPRPGLVIPPSAGPQTLHTLAVYFANALDGITAEKERQQNNPPPTPTRFKDLPFATRENLTALLTKMTVHRYNELFKEKDNAEVTTVASRAQLDEANELEGVNSYNLVQTPSIRQLARNFSLALSSYLDNPDEFRKDLQELRPTEPPVKETSEDLSGDEELLNFSDADSKSSYPPIFPTVPSISPTWGYILANPKPNNYDVKNSLNPDLTGADSQSFVPGFNNIKVDKKNNNNLPSNHWTTSPGATNLWRSTFSVNPVSFNKHFDTTEPVTLGDSSSTEDISISNEGGSINFDQPHREIQYELRSLPKLSLNSTQVHGILIDFMNTTKSDDDNRLQRILRKLNTTENEFLNKMKEIEKNPLTRRLILLLISECGANITTQADPTREATPVQTLIRFAESAKQDDQETLKRSSSNYHQPERITNSDNNGYKTLVDHSLKEDDQDTRALQLLNSLYTIASKFGK